MRPTLKIIVLVACVTSSVLAFQNCAESLPDVSDQPSVLPETHSTIEPLTLAYAPLTMAEDIVLNLEANEGLSPYVFALESSVGGSITGQIVRTPKRKGPIVIKVTDAAGTVVKTTLNIPADSVHGSYAASCMSCHNDLVNSVMDCDCLRMDAATYMHSAINYGRCDKSGVMNNDGTLTCE